MLNDNNLVLSSDRTIVARKRAEQKLSQLIYFALRNSPIGLRAKFDDSDRNGLSSFKAYHALYGICGGRVVAAAHDNRNRARKNRAAGGSRPQS